MIILVTRTHMREVGVRVTNGLAPILYAEHLESFDER
jgi:hypothetical protein